MDRTHQIDGDRTTLKTSSKHTKSSNGSSPKMSPRQFSGVNSSTELDSENNLNQVSVCAPSNSKFRSLGSMNIRGDPLSPLSPPYPQKKVNLARKKGKKAQKQNKRKVGHPHPFQQNFLSGTTSQVSQLMKNSPRTLNHNSFNIRMNKSQGSWNTPHPHCYPPQLYQGVNPASNYPTRTPANCNGQGTS
jgi:hypothetical protein